MRKTRQRELRAKLAQALGRTPTVGEARSARRLYARHRPIPAFFTQSVIWVGKRTVYPDKGGPRIILWIRLSCQHAFDVDPRRRSSTRVGQRMTCPECVKQAQQAATS